MTRPASIAAATAAVAAKGDSDVNYDNVGMEMSDSGDRFCSPTTLLFKIALELYSY